LVSDLIAIPCEIRGVECPHAKAAIATYVAVGMVAAGFACVIRACGIRARDIVRGFRYVFRIDVGAVAVGGIHWHPFKVASKIRHRKGTLEAILG
jgi:hypothetical protein